MKKLYELAKLVRSKNAGPFVVTMDVLFDDHETYERVLGSGALDAGRIAALYGVPEEAVQRYELPLANAVKFSMTRKVPSGDVMDEDLYGCQFHRPLVMLEVDVYPCFLCPKGHKYIGKGATTMMKRILTTLIATILLVSLACGAMAEEWQWNQRVEIMVPAGEGGGLDTTIRKFNTYLAKELGTDITVNNQSAGVGVTGYTWSYNSTNDGFAFQFTAPTAIISAAQGLFTGFDLMEELIPVSGLVMAEGILFSRLNAPWTTVEEMIAYAKEHPGEVTVAVDSPNGISGAIMTEFETGAGIELKWITSDSAEGYISAIAGDVDLCINTWSDAGAYVDSGDLLALVVMADGRNEAYPDVTPTGELGIETTLGYYRVFTALKGTPQAAVDSFEAAVKRAVENPEWQEWLAANGMTNDYVWTQAELGEVLNNTYETAVELNAAK